MLPGWNPLTSASSGAALGSFLAAVVLNSTIQIALARKDAQADGTGQSISLRAAPPTFVTILIATYLYIVLAGVNGRVEACYTLNGTTSQTTVQEIGSTSQTSLTTTALSPCQELGNLLDMASAAFAISGTVLAIGALLTFFVIFASVKEGVHSQIAAPWASAVFDIAACLLVLILLLGYNTGARAAGDDTGNPVWWLTNALSLILPACVIMAASTRSRRRAAARHKQEAESRLSALEAPLNLDSALPISNNQPQDTHSKHLRRRLTFEKILPWLSIALVAAVPTAVALFIVTLGPDTLFLPVSVASIGSSIYYSVTAGILWSVKSNVPPPTKSPYKVACPQP